jgi:succinate dehydrogenase flavin-adding protein (antitoxin of CptAB toxin-antitoxin module)
MESILTNGFQMCGLNYKEPNSVLSALQVIGDVTLSASSQQFGGFTIAEVDKILVKYIKKSINNLELEQETGFTRQALSKKESIVKAYKEANQSSNIIENIGRRAEETQSKLDKVKEENIKLKKLLADYDETFVRWFANATSHGMSIEELEAPLPHSMKTKARLKDLKK